MAVVSRFSQLRQAQDANGAWQLLRARNAALIMAVLDAHFDERNRRIPVSDLANSVDFALQELRFRANIDYEHTGADACEQWRKKGYLVRRTSKQRREETYELSAEAMTAIAFAKQLVQPRHTATQSRLSLIMDAVHDLAVASSSDVERRKKSLLADRAAIDAELEKIEQGTYVVIDDSKGLERLSDILALMNEIPEDFAHVKTEFAQLNKTIFESIISYSDNYRDILEDIFAGVNHIAQSPAGRSFLGFYDLMRDNDLTESFQDDIDDILGTPFATALASEERRQLHSMTRNLLEQSSDVNEVMLSFGHGLQRFVQSHRYQTDRQIKKDIDRALADLHKLSCIASPQKTIDASLHLSSISIQPVARWRLRNPAEIVAAPLEEISSTQVGRLSLEELYQKARQSEIDFEELVENVNDVLRCEHERRTASVKDVLEKHPATQGAASIVGLLSLAYKNGRPVEGEDELAWETEHGTWRCALAPRYEFYQEVQL
ncbi:DUF3375 domain-containing protein [Xiamenia xianingshaonis]|uniref:DUF3375 domain-containing protein n=1 Tax=Xiamenia xianingshaonis TaxID=2682776 RepID=A0A9E6MQ47_9ACTN|nr:DUF3375 domain-containing protein [Xiamenia xianingshaonis]QTU84206.1 DUF3375 domain-containing protein [Xiamenia xianingshaonis]